MDENKKAEPPKHKMFCYGDTGTYVVIGRQINIGDPNDYNKLEDLRSHIAPGEAMVLLEENELISLLSQDIIGKSLLEKVSKKLSENGDFRISVSDKRSVRE
ncbi:MAG: hypothetical protein PHH54_07280 [Candidatus Nanoarchaeia archaeon]|nr:hypothetical protein [Candidatus Nanoarchaeia archaeon]MDD5741758.1 hypothetical protein [Candidatus Nanoarchaeia archaeon]